MNRLKQTGVRIVNFEDLGEGRHMADAVVNALYERQDDAANAFWGDKYYLIRDEFLLEKPKNFSEDVKEILVIFGGTDPNNLTDKTVQALLGIAETTDVHCTVILGMGYQAADAVRQKVSVMPKKFDVVQDVKLITEYMGKADLAISSQGRTMLELVAMGVPTILMAQNERETIHEFGSLRNGFLNLGLGRTVQPETICETVQWLMHCPQIRKSMRDEMLAKDLTHGIGRVKQIILGENEI
jgi:spore coat polysaccharide biosynthesis predicted glycosyltransferase SpsG